MVVFKTTNVHVMNREKYEWVTPHFVQLFFFFTHIIESGYHIWIMYVRSQQMYINSLLFAPKKKTKILFHYHPHFVCINEKVFSGKMFWRNNNNNNNNIPPYLLSFLVGEYIYVSFEWAIILNCMYVCVLFRYDSKLHKL